MHNAKLFNLLYLLFVYLFSCNNKHNINNDKINILINNHSYSNYRENPLQHLFLDLEINFNKKIFKGTATLYFHHYWQQESIILDTKGLNVMQIMDETNQKLEFWYAAEDSILGKALKIIVPHRTKNITIFYETTAQSDAIQWLTPEQTFGKTLPFVSTQSQAILARSWIPLQDVPAVRFTYAAKIKTDIAVLPLMSAINPQSKNDSNMYYFNMPQAIPSYLMALCAGDLVFSALGDSCGVYADPKQIAACEYEFSDLENMISNAANLYGPYQWGRYDMVILPPSFPFGGMENPRLTFATPTIITGDRSLVSLVAHELAHSWSGNLVTNETWSDFWLNEGFTVYFESRIMEQLYGKMYSEMLTELGKQELLKTIAYLKTTQYDDTKLYLNLKNRNPDDAVTDIAYEKGRFFLLLIEKTVGRKNFDVFLKNYFLKKSFKTINTAQFINLLNEELLSKNPIWKNSININQWIFENGLPENCPIINSSELNRAEMDANTWLRRNVLPNTKNYTTHHWLHFFRSLKKLPSTLQIKTIDSVYHFTGIANAEIACDWYQLCINAKYKAAYPAMTEYLKKIGRRKFLLPLYGALVKTESGKVLANDIFNQAIKGYHAVSIHSIKQILN